MYVVVSVCVIERARVSLCKCVIFRGSMCLCQCVFLVVLILFHDPVEVK